MFTKFEVKTKERKKKVIIRKYTRIFINCWVKPQKQTVFVAKSTKKQLLLTNSEVVTSILGQASNCTPVAFSLLTSLDHNPRLGGTIPVGEGVQAVLWGVLLGRGMPPMVPGLKRSIFFRHLRNYSKIMPHLS